ncbi:ABC transporter ATP-binding protein [Brevibacillus humidisoli]|uniref:ABC transporter ATP-binding protein n=1 Tax=Brevibacillus humidisoli TaxID=2895522 RepID=UPI001E5FDE93|nr:DUF3744 domain-containing protein [Brevibacillus humidisoli]UFJ39486.1 ABC transporter ATP-binding protein [Brevibacillus humidisoli]
MEPIVSVKQVSYTYEGLKHPTIREINLDIRRGEKILIAGPSGSGKSTLARCLNGLIPHSYKGELQGQIIIDGKPTSSMRIVEISESVGTILQDPEGQFVGLSVGEDVAFALENQEMSYKEMVALVKEALAKVNMVSQIDKSPQELSGGQKQKVAIAGIPAMNPDILLFDEPLANLDPQSGQQVMALIDEIHQRYNKTIIIVEHRIEEVLEIGMDRIILMEQGEIVADDSASDVVSSGKLKQTGIRHPLYLEALERAGLTYTAETIPLAVSAVERDDVLPSFRQWQFHTAASDAPLVDTAPLLQFDDVWFSYTPEEPLLKAISFAVRPGERIALLGHNGAGKSTLSHLMLGILKPLQGRIFLEGKPAESANVIQRGGKIGYVMQNPHHMISQETVKDEVAFGPRNFGLDEAEVLQRVEEALHVCDLLGHKNWPVSALSFGQKKRLTIASILSMKPRVLLLDEPTAGQDYRHYREMMDFISRLTETGIALLMVTHDMHLALEYTSRSIVLSQGEIIGDMATSRLFADEPPLTAASLRTTSLYQLAKHLGVAQPDQFIQYFIDADRQVKTDAIV